MKSNTNDISVVAPKPKDPLFWVSEDEHHALSLLKDDQAKVAWLFVAFSDPTVERLEAGVFVRGYLQAVNGEGAKELTALQEKAIRLRSEVMQRGRTNVQQWVGHKLGISQPAACKILQRADAILETNRLYSDEILAIDNRDVVSPHDEALIQNWFKNNPRECGGWGRPSQHGIPACEGKASFGHSLCWPCTRAYGLYNEWPDWLRFKVNDIKKEHRRAAIEALYMQLDEDTPAKVVAKVA